MCIIYQCFIKKKVIIESHHVWWSSSGRRLGDLEPWVTGPWGSGTCRHDRCGGGASWPPGGAAAPRQATLARPPRSPAGGAQGCAASLLGGSCPHGPFPEPASREHAKAAGGSRGSDAAQVLQPPPRGPSPPAAGWGRSSPAGAGAVRGPGQALSTSLSDLGATLSATAWKVAGSVRRAPPPRASASGPGGHRALGDHGEARGAQLRRGPRSRRGRAALDKLALAELRHCRWPRGPSRPVLRLLHLLRPPAAGLRVRPRFIFNRKQGRE